MARALIAGLVAVVAAQGCGTFTQPKADPVIEDRITDAGWGKLKVGVLATTPERRVMVVQMPNNRFCAEPPADAADNVSAALTAVAQASAQGRVTEAQLGLAQTLATSVTQLFHRSQGVQLYRDGSFMLCNAYLNGAITEAQFLERHSKLLEIVAPLIEKEIPEMHKAQRDLTAKGQAPTAPSAPEIKFPPRRGAGASEEGRPGDQPTEDGGANTKE